MCNLRVLALIASVLLLSAGSARGDNSTAAPGVKTEAPRWKRDHLDPRWVTGRVAVGAEPASVWARVAKIEEWPRIFSDVKRLKVNEHRGEEWLVNLDTVSMDCGPHDYRVTFNAERSTRIRIDAPGVEAVAVIEVKPGPTPTTAFAEYRLMIEARGLMSWFVSERNLRQMQEQMVARYLGDFERVFGRPVSAPDKE